MTAPTLAARRHAAQQALALVVAGMKDQPREPLMAKLLGEVDDVALVVGSLVGLTMGFLKSIDEIVPGAAERFLHGMGLSFETMTEEDG